MKKADFCYRISGKIWQDATKFVPLLELLANQKNKVQDIALFVGPSHSVQKLECIESILPRLKCALQEIREYGFGCGINILTLMGHHYENGEMVPEDVSPLTGTDGRVCRGTLCSAIDSNKEYLRKLLLMLVSTKPDYIWLDDDIRFAGHGDIMLVCFCEQCIKDFNQKFGTSLSREEISTLFNSGSEQEKLIWRRRWLSFSGERLRDFFKFAEKIVHDADPEIALGAMDAGMRAGDSASMEDIAMALAGNSELPLRWRPGGGAYTERIPEEFLYKAHMLGCESAYIPDFVDNIQAEIENFNYQRLNKSVKATTCEASLYVAAGLTGAAWNCLEGDDPLYIYEKLIKGISNIQPFIDKQAAYARVRPAGIWHGWQPGLSAAGGLDNGASWESALYSWQNPHFSQLFTGGFSPAYRLQDAKAVILTADAARILSEDDLAEVFRRGVYCLAEALPVLEKRGMAHLTGFRIAGQTQFDAVEQLLPHPLNEGSEGFLRDCRQSFPWGHEYGWHLESTDGNGVSLARLINYQNRELASCSLGIYENALGGRVAVAGYYPLRDLHFERKLNSLKKLFRWLTRDTIPAEVLSYHRMAVWTRSCGGKTIVQMCNAFLDPAENVTIRVDSTQNTAVLTDWTLKEQIIQGTPDGTGKAVFTLPEITPWQTIILEVQ